MALVLSPRGMQQAAPILALIACSHRQWRGQKLAARAPLNSPGGEINGTRQITSQSCEYRKNEGSLGVVDVILAMVGWLEILLPLVLAIIRGRVQFSSAN